MWTMKKIDVHLLPVHHSSWSRRPLSSCKDVLFHKTTGALSLLLTISSGGVISIFASCMLALRDRCLKLANVTTERDIDAASSGEFNTDVKNKQSLHTISG